MAYDQIHIVDATSQMIEVSLRSSTTGMLLTGKAYGDMTVKYQREGAASATIVSVVTATKGAYTSGGFVETDIAGLYQFGIPAGALATGALAVTITFACTGAIDAVKRIVLIGADLRNANSLGLAYLTGDAFTELGAPAGASVSADVAAVKSQTSAIETDTQDLQSQIGTAGAGLSAADDAVIAAIAALNNLSSAQAQSAATAALNAYDPPTNAELEARTLVAANYFDPAADTVARVTLVDTTTTNTDLAPVKAVTDKIDTTLVQDGAVYDFTAAALAAAPAGGAGSSDLDEILADHDTEDTLGNVLNDLVEEAAGLYRLTTAALAMAPGGGGTLYFYSDTVDDGSGNLLDGVYVQLSSTSNFADIIATTYTNAIGAFTVRSDTAGTHYLRLQLAGYNFSDQTVILA